MWLQGRWENKTQNQGRGQKARKESWKKEITYRCSPADQRQKPAAFLT